MTNRAFTSDRYRDIYKEAIRQGWIPVERRKSGHKYLVCPHPDCNFREIFSTTGRGQYRELRNTVTALRRHGFLWEGRGGKHIAEPFLSAQKVDEAG